MRVGQERLSGGLVAGFVPPDLGISEEEPLITGKAVQNRRWFAVQRKLVGSICNIQARKICDVFAQRQLSIHIKIWQRTVRTELFGQRAGPRVKVLAIVRCPPVLQLTRRIILAALVVKAM